MKSFLLLLMLCLIYSTQAALIVEYKFDGNALDSSGHSHNGTLLGNATYSTGRFGQALSLDGAGDYMHANLPNYTYSQFTLEAWIKVPNYTANLHYISLYQNAFLVLGNWGSGTFTTWANGLNPVDIGSSGSISPAVWHHVAFTYDGQYQRLYIDGSLNQEVLSSASVAHTSTFNQGLNIGARYTGDSQFVTGYIDNVRIYNEALSASQVGFFQDAGTAPVPEPTTGILLAMGVVGLLYCKRCKD